jgi:hypothetical protein
MGATTYLYILTQVAMVSPVLEHRRSHLWVVRTRTHRAISCG